jgi:hypothetical protein
MNADSCSLMSSPEVWMPLVAGAAVGDRDADAAWPSKPAGPRHRSRRRNRIDDLSPAQNRLWPTKSLATYGNLDVE